MDNNDPFNSTDHLGVRDQKSAQRISDSDPDFEFTLVQSVPALPLRSKYVKFIEAFQRLKEGEALKIPSDFRKSRFNSLYLALQQRGLKASSRWVDGAYYFYKRKEKKK